MMGMKYSGDKLADIEKKGKKSIDVNSIPQQVDHALALLNRALEELKAL